ncbi:hypothetical protein CH16_gp115 [Escherichia phage KBNP1711]|uniref:Uncharacterized protein n=1 Tax=Escherichia phage KBNP1711 TaxID=1436889 RepID=W6AS16_9CAUD|nr:hypothetical protein CH16_gp115 [Escherichia phage KBNP1711]AHI60892.1 hypothetical protein ECBP3_0115 [Escherichia phage KBNP1711]
MKVNIKSNRTMLRLNNMKPGVLFESKGFLYIRTDSLYADNYVNCVDVVTGKLVPIKRDEVCQVRNDLHITNIEAKDED